MWISVRIAKVVGYTTVANWLATATGHWSHCITVETINNILYKLFVCVCVYISVDIVDIITSIS